VPSLDRLNKRDVVEVDIGCAFRIVHLQVRNHNPVCKEVVLIKHNFSVALGRAKTEEPTYFVLKVNRQILLWHLVYRSFKFKNFCNCKLRAALASQLFKRRL
jgi:hypothetical protein